MTKGLTNRVWMILAVIIGCLLCMYPIDQRINLGLDLKGGMHLVLKVDTKELSDKAKKDAVPRAIEILRNRIDSLGVGETVLQRQGEDQILLQLPGVTDRNKAVEIVKRVAHLEFRLVSKDQEKLQEALKGNEVEGFELKATKGDDKEKLLVEKKAALKGSAIVDAKVDADQFGMPNISITFNAEGSKEFGELTQAHVGDRLAIVLDQEVLSAPNIREAILTGNAQITGQFNYEEASVLAMALRSGSLPAPVYIEEERTIGPLLGKDSINDGFKAMVIGGLLVFAFMTLYYFIGGIVASLALLLNLLITVGIMAFLNIMLPMSQVTLTLPGIAGLALTLAMAVDANVLINERIREELDNGRSLAASIHAGYDKALTAIIDSNITTLVAACMLFYFGSGPIKGFAITLTIGLLASLFTAVFVTKTIFMFLTENNIIKSLPMMQWIKETKIDFIAKAPFFFFVSLIIIGVGMFNLYQKKDAAYGIDFSGGQVQEYRFEKAIPSEEIRAVLTTAGVKAPIIQRFEKEPENVIIRTNDDTYELVSSTFASSFKDNKAEVLRLEKVGPVVGKKLRLDAIWAMLFALAGILIYVGFRFKHFDFATAGVVALFHDVVVALGLTVFFGKEVDLLTVTALLTIAGYSINDTIVIYDRVRENIAKFGKKMSIKDILNLSVNQTLARTILTTLTTALVVLSFYFIGGEVLNSFSLTLLIGMIAGIYSTVFMVSPIVVWWNTRNVK